MIPRRIRAAVGAVAGAMLAATMTATSPPGDVDAAFPVADRFVETPGPLGAVTVIGDSVLYGSVVLTPHVGEQLAARGWGPVRVRGGGSYTTGYFAVGDRTRASHWLRVWSDQGWDAPNVIVNLGTNDSGLCGTDLACARAAILHVVDAIGPGHRIWWPKITRRPVDQRYADTWNLALDQLAAERTDLFTWDWPSVMRSDGYRSGDGIHLDPDGYRRRSVAIADAFTDAVGRADRVGSDAPLPSPLGPPSGFLPVGPIRVADTREGPQRVSAGGTLVVDLSEHLPDDANAVAVYAAAVDPAARGFLTVHDCGPRPAISSVNHSAGRTRGAVAISAVSSAGQVCVYARSETDVVVDLQGVFVADTGLRLDPVEPPVRLLDTRAEPAGAASTIEIPVTGSGALVVSISAIGGERPGFVTATDCSGGGRTPSVATVNHGAHEIVAGSAFVEIGDRDSICVYVRSDADLTVDLTGRLSPDGALRFRPVVPTRTIDTRDATGGWFPVQGAGQTIDARVAPDRAEAVSGTLTLVAPASDGHLRAWGCGDLPATSNVNAPSSDVRANAVTTGLAPGGRLCVFARSRGDTVFDTTGWWVPEP